MERLIKSRRPDPDFDTFIFALWLMYLRAPATRTAPGEQVDLGEIGEDRSSRGVDRPTPYSPGRVK